MFWQSETGAERVAMATILRVSFCSLCDEHLWCQVSRTLLKYFHLNPCWHAPLSHFDSTANLGCQVALGGICHLLYMNFIYVYCSVINFDDYCQSCFLWEEWRAMGHKSRSSLNRNWLTTFTNHNFHFLTFKFHNYFLVSVFHLEYNGHHRGRIWIHVGFWWHILGANNVFLAGTVSCWPTREAPLDNNCCNCCFIRYVKKSLKILFSPVKMFCNTYISQDNCDI